MKRIVNWFCGLWNKSQNREENNQQASPVIVQAQEKTSVVEEVKVQTPVVEEVKEQTPVVEEVKKPMTTQQKWDCLHYPPQDFVFEDDFFSENDQELVLELRYFSCAMHDVIVNATIKYKWSRMYEKAFKCISSASQQRKYVDFLLEDTTNNWPLRGWKSFVYPENLDYFIDIALEKQHFHLCWKLIHNSRDINKENILKLLDVVYSHKDRNVFFAKFIEDSCYVSYVFEYLKISKDVKICETIVRICKIGNYLTDFVLLLIELDFEDVLKSIFSQYTVGPEPTKMYVDYGIKKQNRSIIVTGINILKRMPENVVEYAKSNDVLLLCQYPTYFEADKEILDLIAKNNLLDEIVFSGEQSKVWVNLITDLAIETNNMKLLNNAVHYLDIVSCKKAVKFAVANNYADFLYKICNVPRLDDDTVKMLINYACNKNDVKLLKEVCYQLRYSSRLNGVYKKTFINYAIAKNDCSILDYLVCYQPLDFEEAGIILKFAYDNQQTDLLISLYKKMSSNIEKSHRPSSFFLEIVQKLDDWDTLARIYTLSGCKIKKLIANRAINYRDLSRITMLGSSVFKIEDFAELITNIVIEKNNIKFAKDHFANWYDLKKYRQLVQISNFVFAAVDDKFMSTIFVPQLKEAAEQLTDFVEMVSVEFLTYYVKKFSISNNIKLQIINHGLHDILALVIEKEECDMILKGNSAKIIEYVSAKPLCKKAQKLLIERNNQDELAACYEYELKKQKGLV